MNCIDVLRKQYACNSTLVVQAVVQLGLPDADFTNGMDEVSGTHGQRCYGVFLLCRSCQYGISY